ncbi:MAG: hypothetical protein IKS36_04795, partial [Bacteroidales bacterium]|nr:hypothetical protein [Bacteroidales bacterium]
VSGQAGEALLSVDIPQSGFYYVLLRTTDPSEFGTCNLCINEDKCFDNVPICSSSTVIQHPFISLSCCYFAVSKNGDPFICLMGEDDCVNAHNDDYPFNPGKSNYNWGKNARINRPSGQKGWLFTTTKSYPGQSLPKCDIYVECRSAGVDTIKYPNLKPDDAITSHSPSYLSEYYNCISWSVGVWREWIQPMDDKEKFDSFYAQYGYCPTNSESSATIDIWMNNDGDIHASVKSKGHKYSAGYDWESKMGQGIRLFHPRNAFQGGKYEKVVAYYMKDNNMVVPYPGPGPVLDFSFSESEMTQIDNGIKKIPNNVKDLFWKMYNDYQNDSSIMYLSDARDFDRARVYKTLLNYCINNPIVINFLYKEASKRSVLPFKLLQDIAARIHPELESYVEESCKHVCDNGKGITSLNVQAMEILLSKALLAGVTSLKEVEDIAQKNVSQREMISLSVTVQEQTAHVSFVLSEKSEVSLMLVDLNSFEKKDIIKSQTLESGKQSVTFPIEKFGLYSIGLIINGGLYDKKFKVE